MSRLLAIYNELKSIDDHTVDQALAAALPTADPQAASLICQRLLERGHAQSTAALVEQFHRLPPQIQTTMIQRVDRLYSPLRKAANLKIAQSAKNVIHIIDRAQAGRLAYLVVEQLYHRPDEVRRCAASCLHRLAQHARAAVRQAAPGVESVCDTVTAHYIRSAIEEAVGLYRNHHQPGVLLALTQLAPRSIPAAIAHLSDPDHEAVEAMQALLAHPRQAQVCRAMLVMIRLPPLTEAVLSGLSRINTGQALANVLQHGHLLLDQRVAKPLSRFKDAHRLWPDDEQRHRLDAAATRSLPRWAGALAWPPQVRALKLARLRDVADPLTRLAALRQLMAMADDPSSKPYKLLAVAAYCFDPRASLARIAVGFLISQRWEGLDRLLPRLANSPHEQVRRLAGERLAPKVFHRMWQHWPGLSTKDRLSLGRAMVKIDPRFMAHLAVKLENPDRSTTLRAMDMIRELNLCDYFEKTLLALLRSTDEVVVASAVKTAGMISNPATTRAIEAALDHADPRVRANVIESLYQSHLKRHTPRLTRMAEREANRPRANAIGALMQTHRADALSSLKRMLTDGQPMQRVSALWLVETMGLIEVARFVAEMAVSDPDPRVRDRADHVVRRLIDVMRPATPTQDSSPPQRVAA